MISASPGSPCRSPTLSQVGAPQSCLPSRRCPLQVSSPLSSQGNPERRRLARAATVEVGVEGRCCARGRPLGRSHTLDTAERITGLTGGTGAPPPAPEATSTSHAGSVSADQSQEPSQHCLHLLPVQGSHLDLNGELEPRLHTTQTDGGQPAGRCS